MEVELVLTLELEIDGAAVGAGAVLVVLAPVLEAGGAVGLDGRCKPAWASGERWQPGEV